MEILGREEYQNRWVPSDSIKLNAEIAESDIQVETKHKFPLFFLKPLRP